MLLPSVHENRIAPLKICNFFGENALCQREYALRFARMARYSDKVETNEQAIRDFAESLRLLAVSFERQADFMRESGLNVVQITHWKSAKLGVSNLAAFAAAIQDAVVETKMIGELDRMIATGTPKTANANENTRTHAKKKA